MHTIEINYKLAFRRFDLTSYNISNIIIETREEAFTIDDIIRLSKTKKAKKFKDIAIYKQTIYDDDSENIEEMLAVSFEYLNELLTTKN